MYFGDAVTKKLLIELSSSEMTILLILFDFRRVSVWEIKNMESDYSNER
jgi:hypothetical protein